MTAPMAIVVFTLAMVLAPGNLTERAEADDTASAAQVTRTLRILKVTDASEHPGGTFSGSVSLGEGPFTISLAANALTSEPVEFSIGTGAYGVAETGWPPGWSRVGYHILGDPAGNAVCDPSSSYGTPNIIPEGEEDVLFCIKNSYVGEPVPRSLRLGVVSTEAQHPAAQFTVQLSTGDQIELVLPENGAAVHGEVEISTGSVGAQLLAPADWRSWRGVVVSDSSGTGMCAVGLVNLSPTVPAGDGQYLMCFEATYYPPGLPTPVRIGVLTTNINHPGGSFQFGVGDEIVHVDLGPGAAVASVDLELPREQITVALRNPWPAKWNPRRFWTIGSQVLVDCSQPLPGPGGPGTGTILELGPEPTTFCFQVAYVPYRLFAPMVAAD